MKYREIDVNYLRERILYFPDTGEIFWKPKEDRLIKWNNRYAGKRAFNSIDKNGYLRGTFGKSVYLAHRIAWTYVHGKIPQDLEIDHVNMIRNDNRIINLRLANKSENQRNTRVSSNNKCGLKGVCWDKNAKKWKAQIFIDGRKIYLGLFSEKNDAYRAYCIEAEKVHLEFCRTA